MMAIIIENFMDCSLDHHDRMIEDLVPEIISSEHEIVGPYFDSRIKTMKYLNSKELNFGILKEENDGTDFIWRKIDIWSDINYLMDEIFEE